MAIIKSFSPFQNLSNFQTFLVDDNPLSDYFRITEFKDTFTGGKNGFLIEGSEFLKETTEVKIELLDVEGNPIYFEPGDGIPEYYEGTSKLVSCHVYDDTPIGLGKITILGELKNYVDENGSVVPVPSEWKGVYNVKWERTFKVNKNLNNEDIVRFYKRPLVNIDELVKPIFTKSVNQVTDTGEVNGVAQLPNIGTNLSTYRGGTFYKLIKTSGTWDVDVDENTIELTIGGSTYSPKIIEVLNGTEVLVDIPYTDDNIVSNFVSQSYSVTYTDFAAEPPEESTLIGSFAKIDITQLKTFVGDVARVKVFRKSRSSANDFQFVQESRLESTELLRDISNNIQDTELPYGRFDETTLADYWVSENPSHPITIDSSVLSQAAWVDYDTNSGGVQRLSTVQSFSISKDVEYTLNFRTLLNGSISDIKYLKAYFSGSYPNPQKPTENLEFTQSFVDITPDGSYVVRKNITENIIAERDIDAKLVFEFVGDDWYISNVSLKNAQDTSFSPDEFTLIQDIPRKLASETFDFRFEFYDINNNYIPVNVVATKTFNGGNDFNTTSKLLTFESDRNAFRYSSGSANPGTQQIQFKVTRQNLTGSVEYDWEAFTQDGTLIGEIGWNRYPGFLTSITTGSTSGGALLTVNNFEGDWNGSGDAPIVYSIIYTATLENLQETETVYRLEDGDNAPTLLVTSNANQFIYEPTTLSPKPSGQSITIRAQRKNLASLSTPITVNKSNPNGPDLTEVSDANGIKTYSISATQFSSSFADNNFDEITYEFTGLDVFDEEQTDEITISKVVNFDGVSINLSNESTTFRANSVGKVLDEFVDGNGEVEVRIGNLEIQHNDGLTESNTFDIISAVATNVTESNPSYSDNTYGITGITGDAGNLVLSIKYLAGDSVSSQTFQKKVNYAKNRLAPPSITIDTTNKTQNVDAKSTGEQLTVFDPSLITVREFYTGSVTTFVHNTQTPGSDQRKIDSLVITSDPQSITTDDSDMNISFVDLPDDINSTQVSFTINLTDSEGGSRTISDSISLSKTLDATPNVEFQISPPAQTIDANSVGGGESIPQSLTVTGREGSFVLIPVISNLDFGSTGLNGTAVDNIISFTTSVSDMISDTATISFTATAENSEGTLISSSLSHTITKAKNAPPNVLVNTSPQSQTVDSGSDAQSIVVSVKEGVNSYTYGSGTNQFNISNLTSGFENNNGTITLLTNPTTTISGTATVNYINSEGTSDSEGISFTIGVTKSGADGEPGIAGPGLTYVGECSQLDSSWIWVNDEDSRHVTSVNGTYYITLPAANTVTKGTTGCPPNATYFEALQSFASVATDILLAKDATITRALTIGTYGSDEGVIRSANAIDFLDGAGMWLDNNGDVRFGDPVGSYVAWDQSTGTLNIKGSIEFVNEIDISEFNNDLGFTDDTVANAAQSDATLALTRPKVFRQPSQPSTDNPNGTLWFDTDDNNKLYILIGTTWTETRDGGITDAIADAAAAETLANGVSSNLQNLIDGQTILGGGTFIDGNIVYSPILSGGNGYISNIFKVGNNGITLDGPNQKIFTGTGTYANANTPFYVDNSSNFSLGDKLSWDGSNLSINGSGTFTGQVSAGGITIGAGANPGGTRNGIYIDDNNYWLDGTGVRFTAGNDTAAFKVSNTGAIGINTTGQALQIFNTATNRQGLVFGAHAITLIAKNVGGNTASNINFGAGTIEGNASGGLIEINPTTAVEINGDLDVNGAINASGNITAYASSDKRLKDNITPLTSPLIKISKIGGYEFDWNENQSDFEGHDVGVIAQEIQEVIPEVVAERKDGYLAVRYEKLVPLLIEGIKELTDRVEKLEEENKKLKEK